MMTFAETFKYYRKNAGYTQEEVANQLMVTPQAVSKWEVGGGTPDISLLVPIADMFGITTDALLGNARKSRDEIFDEIDKIQSLWNADISKDENFGDKYRKYLDLLKNNPDSVELLRAVLNLSRAWLSSCSEEMNDSKKQEIVFNAERFAERLRSSSEDIHSSHCLMYEIYFHGGETEMAEAEMAYFSISGQYTKDRTKYMHLKMENKHSEALPHIESSVSHTLHWLFWDIHNLAGSYRCLSDRESMYKVYQLEHDLLNALSYYNGNYFAYYFQSTARLAQNAAQKGEKEHCFAYLEEMMNALRRLQMQKKQGSADTCILFAGRDEKQTAKMSKSTVLECLAWKSFDGIRNTASFTAICDEVNSWAETF